MDIIKPNDNYQLKKITKLNKEEAVLQLIFGFLLNLHIVIVIRDYKKTCIFPIPTHFCSIHLAILNHPTRELRQNLALVNCLLAQYRL